ncbi:MAG TPA: dual specificity protein phosphatase family protein [Gemmataceae bacterium]|nr:dual specificity protein phosphatase family protein [Gemmataceae bacterium]
MATKVRWILAIAIGAAVVVVPSVRYRMVYENEKRFREVTPGKFYRCGQMSADGLRKNIREHQIKLVINLQDEYPDPLLPKDYWDAPHIPESQVCAEEGAKYVFIAWAGEKGLLPRNESTATHRPQVIDDFLNLCDDPNNYPILIHCLAGLHRTGALTAVYRMEYEGWSVADAVRELRANGYGDRKATTANDYIYEYLFQYQPRARGQASGVRSQKDTLTPDP